VSVSAEQVRKRGLPPLLLGLDKRGQATLPDLFGGTAFIVLRKVSQRSAEKRALGNKTFRVLRVFPQGTLVALREA
jgi:hypothetical protein